MAIIHLLVGSEQYITILEKLAKGNKSAKSLDRRDVLRLQADAPVKNTGKTRYNS